tara:strand:- start:941 stop:1666 length:726 start_codon:yes stop_codon:yes gene_type:complete
MKRSELAKEIALRQHVQDTLQELTERWSNLRKQQILENQEKEQSLRKAVQGLISSVLHEDMNQSKQEAAISLVRDTLLAVVKIIKADQAKFTDPEIQDGFIKYCLIALKNDFEESHGEEGDEMMTEAIEDDGDENIDISIKPTDHAMFIADEEEDILGDEDVEELEPREAAEEAQFETLSDSEKVGFRYAKETTWPKVTKQIKRIHKMAMPDPEIARIYEEWLTKNIELHGQNTKEETADL